MPDYAVLVKFCCVHSVSFLSKIYTLILHQHRLIVKSEIFVFAGRIFRFGGLPAGGDGECRILSKLFLAQFPSFVLRLFSLYATIYLHSAYAGMGCEFWITGDFIMIKYKFSNKLMFALVMQDEELCAELIERLFPGKRIKSLTFPNNIQITPEKTIVTGLLSRSVRLDVIKPSYVIFICMHDPFQMGEAVYRFQQIDINLQLKLNDGTYTIFLATDCPKGKIPKELESFFTYVGSGEVAENDDFVKRIHQKVEEANQDAEVTEIMTIEEEMKIRYSYGYKEGERAGLEKGRSEGRSEGEALKQREIAKNFKESGIPIDVIAKNTGLTAKEVEKL